MPVTPEDTLHPDIEDEVVEVFEDTKDAAIRFIQERPLTAVLSALAIGFIAGKLVL